MTSHQSQVVQKQILEQDLRNLYQFIENIRNLQHDVIDQIKFANGMRLEQIAHCLARDLNVITTEYNKRYVGFLCNFLCITKIPTFKKYILLLNKDFYCCLNPILVDIIRFWEENKSTDKFLVARKRLIAFLRILCQIHRGKPKLQKRTLNQELVSTLIKFSPPNDQKILQLYTKLIFQCSKIACNQQKIKLSQILYESLRLNRFPLVSLDESIKTILSTLTIQSLLSHISKQEIVANLKQILKTCFKQQNIETTVDLNKLSIFLTTLIPKESYSCNKYNLYDIFQLCDIKKQGNISQAKKHCVENILEEVTVNSTAQEHQLFAYLQKNGELKNDLFLSILPKILTKLGSVCLIQLLQTQLIQKLIKIIVNKQQSIRFKMYALKCVKSMAVSMQNFNFTISDNLHRIINFHTKQIEVPVRTNAEENLIQAFNIQLRFFEL